MTDLARLTWPTPSRRSAGARLASVPVGSLEQHGPHLTLDTDLAVAEALARRLDSELGPGGLALPVHSVRTVRASHGVSPAPYACSPTPSSASFSIWSKAWRTGACAGCWWSTGTAATSTPFGW